MANNNGYFKNGAFIKYIDEEALQKKIKLGIANILNDYPEFKMFVSDNTNIIFDGHDIRIKLGYKIANSISISCKELEYIEHVIYRGCSEMQRALIKDVTSGIKPCGSLNGVKFAGNKIAVHIAIPEDIMLMHQNTHEKLMHSTPSELWKYNW